MRAYRIAYDGAPYRGFQRQPDVTTVEDALFDALRALDVLADGAPKPPGYAAAGRTDAGVSALAQTVAFEAPDWLSPRALNAELPADVRAWAHADAPADFHATHDASERTYEYHLYAPRADDGGAAPDEQGGGVGGARGADGGSWPADGAVGFPDGARPVDDDRVDAACETLTGTHDYHNLTPDDRRTARTLTLDAARDGPFLVVTARAGGFSRQLVRRLVELVRRVGAGAASFETVDRVLDPEPVPGHEGIPPAPAAPLVLAAVTYPDLDFAIDEDAAASARGVFERRRIERLAGSRVSRHLRDGIK